jgi:Periplasmic molybdate-binding protein/domain
VASGMADVGFGVEPAAHHFGLDFIPIVDEDYYFACDRARLERTPLATVIGLLRGAAFRHSVEQLEGYDPATAANCSISMRGLAQLRCKRL